MRLLVVGAAGRTGRLVLEQAAARGHEVTALARRPVAGPHAMVVGDATDPTVLPAAVAGQDAVVMAVGGSAIVRALAPAMADAGVRRLVMTSSRSVVATRPKLVLDLVWWRFRGPYADLARAEGMLEGGPLDWSVVRATMLADGPARGRVHTDFEPDATGGDWRLTRADYAMALLDVTEDTAMVRRAVGVGGPKG
ncbi:NAD(P)-dependent oxidoreductase [Pseudonocardia humida]|uniref:NAD(P)H-binding protein n=1 Tax=Pseudonocardia humida TaxID=2800819 RepID=A0ABT0ZSP1_9PSEU|nr:NAD(P)H-binding protein [Pseudonocardia humida]MCO1653724.1 NAD(P)H-binding protein [Pseudonocardia humida]